MSPNDPRSTIIPPNLMCGGSYVANVVHYFGEPHRPDATFVGYSRGN